ncbi:MAG: hypothetical protein Q9190_007294 [Brigantiaea leucoxantha]
MPLLWGSKGPTPDQLAAERDKRLHLPSRLALLLVTLPLNIFTLGLVTFRHKYSQTDFSLPIDISILLVFIGYYTACLSVLLNAVIMGVRPPAIILIVSLSLTLTAMLASYDLLTTTFIGLPVSLTAAMDFVCLAPHLPILRKSRVKDFIWQPWLQDTLLPTTQKTRRLSDTFPRRADTGSELRGRTADVHLVGAPPFGPPRRSFSQQREEFGKTL